MTKDEALKMALDALNDLATWNDGEVGSHMDEPYAAEVARLTITAIKKALAHPEQEPVAWATMVGDFAHVRWGSERPNYPIPYEVPLYTTPPQIKPLTDEQWQVIADTLDCLITRKQKDAIEAALGIKEKP